MSNLTFLLVCIRSVVEVVKGVAFVMERHSATQPERAPIIFLITIIHQNSYCVCVINAAH